MDKTIQKSIESWIEDHKEQMLEDIKMIIRIPSIADSDAEIKPYGQPCIDVLEKMLALGESYGFKTKNYENRCGSLCLKEDADENTIGFWGHLDVVPVGNNWSYNPFEPVIKDNFLIGRGADDNKGPTVAVMYIIRCLNDLGIPLKHALKMFVGCDEEHGMSDIEYYAANYTSPKMCIIADSGFPVCYGEKGILEINLLASDSCSSDILDINGGIASNMVPDYCYIVLKSSAKIQKSLVDIGSSFKVTTAQDTVKIESFGVSMHSATPEGGESAIHKLISVLCSKKVLNEHDGKLFSFLEGSFKDFKGTGLNVALSDEISGNLTAVGSMISLKNGKICQHVNIRYPIKIAGTDVLERISNCCKENGYTVEVILDSKPNYFPKEHPAVTVLTNVFNEMMGLHTEPYVMGGGTYARKLPRAFAFGLGELDVPECAKDVLPKGHGGAHKPDEASYIPNLIKAMNVFAMGIVEVDKLEL